MSESTLMPARIMGLRKPSSPISMRMVGMISPNCSRRARVATPNATPAKKSVASAAAPCGLLLSDCSARSMRVSPVSSSAMISP